MGEGDWGGMRRKRGSREESGRGKEELGRSQEESGGVREES